MGYSTNYSLKVTPLETNQVRKPKTMAELISQIENSGNVDRLALLEDLKKMQTGESVEVTSETLISELRAQSEGAMYALNSDGETLEGCKWYEHDEDIARFSKKNMGWLFTLKGEGEEAGDLWLKYFVGGKMQIAKAVISYEDFDPAKLV